MSWKSFVLQDLDKNTTFNMFGLVNLSRLECAIECRFGTAIDRKKLKKFIHDKFDSEMATGKVEFMGE